MMRARRVLLRVRRLRPGGSIPNWRRSGLDRRRSHQWHRYQQSTPKRWAKCRADQTPTRSRSARSAAPIRAVDRIRLGRARSGSVRRSPGKSIWWISRRVCSKSLIKTNHECRRRCHRRRLGKPWGACIQPLIPLASCRIVRGNTPQGGNQRQRRFRGRDQFGNLLEVVVGRLGWHVGPGQEGGQWCGAVGDRGGRCIIGYAAGCDPVIKRKARRLRTGEPQSPPMT